MRMGLFSKRTSDKQQEHEQAPTRSPDHMVKDFLRGQNLEQVGRVDEAILLYEQAVEERFDAAGPYDRLIFIYQQRNMKADVIRVARASIANIRTYPAKRMWYETQIANAENTEKPLA